MSLADKLHNARSIVADLEREGPRVWDRFTAKRAQTLWYYRSVAEAFRSAGVHSWMLDELERTVREMERRAEAHAAG